MGDDSTAVNARLLPTDTFERALEFIRAFDAWCVSEDDFSGPSWHDMHDARHALTPNVPIPAHPDDG